MATRSKTSSRTGRRSKFLKAIQDHPVAAAGIAGTAVLGAILIGKAAKTAARVVTIKAASNAASDVARAIRGPKTAIRVPKTARRGPKTATRGPKKG